MRVIKLDTNTCIIMYIINVNLTSRRVRVWYVNKLEYILLANSAS